jgi:hypothetical protein
MKNLNDFKNENNSGFKSNNEYNSNTKTVKQIESNEKISDKNKD